MKNWHYTLAFLAANIVSLWLIQSKLFAKITMSLLVMISTILQEAFLSNASFMGHCIFIVLATLVFHILVKAFFETPRVFFITFVVFSMLTCIPF